MVAFFFKNKQGSETGSRMFRVRLVRIYVSSAVGTKLCFECGLETNFMGSKKGLQFVNAQIKYRFD